MFENNPPAVRVANMMQVIPVIDILNGIVVHGVAGQRHKYRRIQSLLCDSGDPSVVLQAFEREFGFDTCYLADLDAIQGRELNRCVIAELARSGLSLIVDRGVRDAADVEELFELGVGRVIVALETLPGLKAAQELCTQFQGQDLILSLDLKAGQLLTSVEEWQNSDPRSVADELIAVGFRRMLVLDLAAVGRETGPATIDLCRQLMQNHPSVSLMTGGGIRSVTDLQALQHLGVDGVLVASAIHNGSITAEDLRQLTSA